MGIGVSIVLLAVGAVLAFGVHVYNSGFDINTVGVVLMVIGAIGLLVALSVMGFGGGWGGGAYRRRTTYVNDAVPVAPVVRRPVVPAARRRVVRETYVDDVV
ncbi:MAG TPA: hypothetical protein VMU63_08205 [Acidimicrobiales bacterium]|nr:hypothetical protein [Acidimicrobiales bacterium]